MKSNVYEMDMAQWEMYLLNCNEPTWRAKQIMDWLYVKRVDSFEQMSNLPKKTIKMLDSKFSLQPLKVITAQVSQDGTVKFLFSLHDNHAIETVILKHDYGNSVCVTTQVGCRIGCTFCASTLGGLKRNLTAGEIVAQVVEAQKYLDKQGERLKSLVVMGSGEPFENYEATIKFVRRMCDPKAFNMGQRRITVSTSGVIPEIYRFIEENWQVGLAISLHAPNDKLRSQLMPINRRFPLGDLLDACRCYIERTGRRLTFEYALIKDTNDTDEHAEQLANILKGMNAFVNIIPMNHVKERKHIRSSKNRLFKFSSILTKNRVNNTVRREHGHDIDAACGQLRSKYL